MYEYGGNLTFALIRLGMAKDAAIELTKPSSEDKRFLDVMLSDGEPQRHCG